jgi:hypothetical protein
MSFRQSGASVHAVCPPGHPLRVTSAYDRVYAYGALASLKSIRSAITAAVPDLVIPCDDLARNQLHLLYAQAARRGPEDQALMNLLESSLGDPSKFPLIDSRTLLIELALTQAIPAPETGVVRSFEELRLWMDRIGLPLVLKTDGTSGGRGVKIVKTIAEAEHAFRELNAPPAALRTLKRALVDQDFNLLGPALRRQFPVVNVQRFIPGPEATIAVACWRGQVLASITTEVLRTWKAKGPASVIKLLPDPEIPLAAKKLAASLHLSGLCGFDFVLEEKTRQAYLIEMNPRATQTAHLPLGSGRNLTAALSASMSGLPTSESDPVTTRDHIALFPSEWQNDSASPWLQSAYHDVPWEEPKLVQLCVRHKLNNGGRLTYENLNRLKARIATRRP